MAASEGSNRLRVVFPHEIAARSDPSLAQLVLADCSLDLADYVINPPFTRAIIAVCTPTMSITAYKY
jgi:hypothetical protein